MTRLPSRMIRKLRQLGGVDDGGPLRFQRDGHEFTGLHRLEKHRGRIWNRAGRLLWRAEMDGRPVKIFECASPTQAEFIAALSSHAELGTFFPEVRMRIGAIIVAEWVDGALLSWKAIQNDTHQIIRKIAAMQAALHRTSLERFERECGFDYLDCLLQRALRFSSILPIDDAIQRIQQRLAELPDLPSRLSHPDFTAPNLVRRGGHLVSIDNELVSQNSHSIFDLFNTVRSFGKLARGPMLERYLRSYADAGGDLAPLLDHAEYFVSIWHLRSIGASLQNDDLRAADQLAREVAADRADEPVLLSCTREILGR